MTKPVHACISRRASLGSIEAPVRSAVAFCLLRDNGHYGRPGGSPSPALLHEHPKHPGMRRRGQLAIAVSGFEIGLIRRERDIAVNCHQLEIMRIRSYTRSVSVSGSGLHRNHFGLGLNLSFDGYLEELIGSKLVPELHAIFIVLVIRSGTRTAQPLLFDIPKFLVQLRPVAAFRAT